MNITIYHNPRCTTSRKVLALIEERGLKPTVIEYLKTPPTAAELGKLVKRMGYASARELLRRREPGSAALLDPQIGEDRLLERMVADPIVIERADRGQRQGRGSGPGPWSGC